MRKLKDFLPQLMPLCNKGYGIFIWDRTYETVDFINTLDELMQYPDWLEREVFDRDVDDDCEVIHITLK